METTKENPTEREIKILLSRLRPAARGGGTVYVDAEEVLALSAYIERLEATAPPADVSERLGRVETAIETLLRFALPEKVVLEDGVARVYYGGMARKVEFVDGRISTGWPTTVEDTIADLLPPEPAFDWTRPLETEDGERVTSITINREAGFVLAEIECPDFKTFRSRYSYQTGEPLNAGATKLRQTR